MCLCACPQSRLYERHTYKAAEGNNKHKCKKQTNQKTKTLALATELLSAILDSHSNVNSGGFRVCVIIALVKYLLLKAVLNLRRKPYGITIQMKPFRQIFYIILVISFDKIIFFKNFLTLVFLREKWLRLSHPTLYGLYGEAPPEMATFLRLQVNKTVGILLDKVYERVGKSVISVCTLTEKGYRRIA